MSQIEELNEFLRWPDPLGDDYQLTEVDAPEDWAQAFTATCKGEQIGTVLVQFITRTPLDASYPAGVRDRLVKVVDAEDEAVGPEALQLTAEKLFAQDPELRRIVLATPVDDVPQIARGEAAGFRYVVDVDVKGGPGQVDELSLLAAEPAWVIEESKHLDDVPTH
ncbi:hypothetical protein [Micrococcoides hystricis]|uniref:N-acetyltransferase n=1 Tax=Micrococcoides hystricis TaxID=1572761 RepID=A0ABV6PBC4_9MICC